MAASLKIDVFQLGEKAKDAIAEYLETG